MKKLLLAVALLFISTLPTQAMNLPLEIEVEDPNEYITSIAIKQEPTDDRNERVTYLSKRYQSAGFEGSKTWRTYLQVSKVFTDKFSLDSSAQKNYTHIRKFNQTFTIHPGATSMRIRLSKKVDTVDSDMDFEFSLPPEIEIREADSGASGAGVGTASSDARARSEAGASSAGARAKSAIASVGCGAGAAGAGSAGGAGTSQATETKKEEKKSDEGTKS